MQYISFCNILLCYVTSAGLSQQLNDISVICKIIYHFSTAVSADCFSVSLSICFSLLCVCEDGGYSTLVLPTSLLSTSTSLCIIVLPLHFVCIKKRSLFFPPKDNSAKTIRVWVLSNFKKIITHKFQEEEWSLMLMGRWRQEREMIKSDGNSNDCGLAPWDIVEVQLEGQVWVTERLDKREKRRIE